MRFPILRSLPLSAVLVAACTGDTFVAAPGSGGQGGNGGSAAGQGGLPNAEGGTSGKGGGGLAGGGNGAASASGGSGGASEEGGMGGEAGVGGDTGQAGEGGGGSGAGGGGATGGAMAGEGGSAGKAGTGGTTSGKGGAAGKAGGGTGGTGPAGGSGGSAGSNPCDMIQCGIGLACNSQGQCVPCAQADTMVFGDAKERFRPSVGWENAMFPRATDDLGGQALVFRMNPANSTNQQIVHVPLDADGIPVGQFVEAPKFVNKDDPDADSGPVVLPAGYALNDAVIYDGYTWANFPTQTDSYRLTILDSDRNDDKRRVYVARWWLGTQAPAGFQGYGVLADFNDDNSDNYSVAYASDVSAKRAYWTRKPKEGSAELWTLAFGKNPSERMAQKVNVKELPPSCVFGEDVEAWIDPKAQRLLFTAVCESGAKRRFFYAPVGATTQSPTTLLATPIKLGGTSGPGVLHTPSLSPNQCTLWYADEGVIYSAKRK